jgi:glutamyl-tRNA reductase
MRLLVTGLSHRTAPLEIRERLAFDPASIPLAIERLREICGPKTECLLLATCNRTEVVLAHPQPEVTRAAVRRFFLEKSGLEPSRLDAVLYRHEGIEAVRHLFRVAASLDSMVVGETQILKQVREAHARATASGSVGGLLDGICRRAFQAAKRVRTETEVGRYPVSISSAATDLARRIFGSLEACTVLVLGAGEMSKLSVRHLVSAGAGRVLVITRHAERAGDLACRVGGEARPFSSLIESLTEADIVIASTSAPHPIVHRGDVAEVMRHRRGRPIFFIDIAVPRDIDPAVHGLENVYLYNLDELQRVVEENLRGRGRAADRAEALVREEVSSCAKWYAAQAATPAITALRRTMDEMREREFSRVRGRLSSLSEDQMALVEQFSRALVNKILHRPTIELRRALETGAQPGDVDLVRRLFGVDEEAPVATSRSTLRAVEGTGRNRRRDGEGTPPPPTASGVA